MVKCPTLSHKVPNNMGDLAQNYADSLDRYFECANRHNAWIDYERKRK